MKVKLVLFFVIFILLMGMMSPPVQSQKLLPLDEWQYDDGTTVYNETALETVQILAGENSIGATRVDTPRPIENDYHYSKIINGGAVMNVSITLDLQETLSVILLTQTGGFPISSHSTFSGSGEIVVQTPEHGTVTEQRSFTDRVMTDYFNGNPAVSLVTAESNSFGFSRLLGESSEGDYLRFGRQYVISTDQSATDSIRNYTITPTFLSLEVRIGINLFILNKSPTETLYEVTSNTTERSITRASGLPQAQLYQYDETNRLPLLIRQTQSAKIGALSLNAFDDEAENPTEVVEYRLVQEEDTTSSSSISSIFSTTEDSTTSKDPLSTFMIVLSLISIIFIKKFKLLRE